MLRSGKVDRQALLASLEPLTVPPSADPHGAAGPGVERHLRTLLGIDEDSSGLVDAGVSSLEMLAAMASINRVHGVRLTVTEAFGLRDVPSLAREIERRRSPCCSGAADTPCPPAPTAPDRCPLSSRQLAYMWICMSGGNANWCNISREIPVARRLSETALTEALRSLFVRHDVLGLALTADWQEQTWTEPAGTVLCGARRGHRRRAGLVGLPRGRTRRAYRAGVRADRPGGRAAGPGGARQGNHRQFGPPGGTSPVRGRTGPGRTGRASCGPRCPAGARTPSRIRTTAVTGRSASRRRGGGSRARRPRTGGACWRGSPRSNCPKPPGPTGLGASCSRCPWAPCAHARST
ncbi:acyl carrier protein [Streptomyces lasalocidi]